LLIYYYNFISKTSEQNKKISNFSNKDKLKTEKNSWGYEDYINYDVCICGNDIVRILLAIKKYSNINIDVVKSKISNKVDWYRKNCKENYIRQFGDKSIDVFKVYSR